MPVNRHTADTGYRHGDSGLWVNPADPGLIYHVGRGVAEEFTPDPDQQILCS